MRLRAILRILGVIVMLTSLSKLPSAALGLALRDGTYDIYLGSFFVGALIGLLLYWPNRAVRYDLRLRDGFLIVTLTWVSASLVSALPFWLGPPHLSFTDAVFEATSGLTTTGATVIVGLDALPRSVLLFRQVLQFLGGMGIVILAVAILPMLKIGGTQLFRAETTGPSRDSKLTPRIAETAKALWLVYLGLTVLCALSFWIAGMDLFDALCHAMSTVSTGGFSTYDAGFEQWRSPLLEFVAIVFMVLGGINFGIHFVAWRGATMAPYYADSELRAYLRILVVASLLVTLVLWFGADYATLSESLRRATFQVVSIMTTTGFVAPGFDTWSGIAPLVLMIVAVVGGCSGSTVGGLKVARVMMVVRQGLREVRQLVHPKGQFLVKMGGRRVSESVVLSVSGFITLWMCCFMVIMLGMSASGLDLVSAFGATVATLTNAGPGLGSVAYSFADASPAAVWLGSFSMLLGRLEVFSVLVLLTPAFWRD
jgi:trk system potassium uptake protein TrkH